MSKKKQTKNTEENAKWGPKRKTKGRYEQEVS